MKLQSTVILLIIFLSLCQQSFAQNEQKYKIKKVSIEDLKINSYSIDTGAAAVVLFDIGKAEFVGNMKGDLSVKFTRHKRVHILRKSAYDEANIEVMLYHASIGNGEEVLDKAEGTTYNIEDGNVAATKLERRKGIFKEAII